MYPVSDRAAFASIFLEITWPHDVKASFVNLARAWKAARDVNHINSPLMCSCSIIWCAFFLQATDLAKHVRSGISQCRRSYIGVKICTWSALNWTKLRLWLSVYASCCGVAPRFPLPWTSVSSVSHVWLSFLALVSPLLPSSVVCRPCRNYQERPRIAFEWMVWLHANCCIL